MSGSGRVTHRAPSRWPGWLVRALLGVAGAIAIIAGLLVLRAALTDDPLERLSATPGRAAGTTVYEGSWYFPRGGPYVLGFQSPGGAASLDVDDRRLASGTGLVRKRRVFDVGIVAVKFTAPAGARLVWHPPGRRGPMEYVPPSSLDPRPPNQARFDVTAGTSPVDGAVAGAILLVLIALAIFLVAPLFPRVHWPTLGWALLVLIGALAVRLYDLGGAGQTWDEDVNWSAGRNYINNWLDGDFRPASWIWNMEHPPVMKYVAGIGAQFADGYGPARALSALMLAIGCALVVPIGRRLFSLPVGVLGAAIAALSPHLIAHGKIVGHESPTVLWWALAIWLCLMAHDPPRVSEVRAQPDGDEDADPDAPTSAPTWWRDPLFARMLVIGAVLGLAVFSRFVNALLAPLIGAILLITAPVGRRKRTVAMGLAIIAPAAILVGLAIWPRLWSEPIAHMQEAWAKLKKPHSAEPFLGDITNKPPRYYFLVYLWATAPLGVILGAGAWLGRAVIARRAELWQTGVLCAWLCAPLIVMLSPVRQDGVRYVMPCLPVLALMAAAGVQFVLAQLARWRPELGGTRALTVAAIVAIGYLSGVNSRIHPYYLDYYGEQVGGPGAVARAKTFEIAWWGEGLGDAIAYVNKNAEQRARVYLRCVEPNHLAWLRGDLWHRLARSPSGADWWIIYQPSWRRCKVPAGAELVHEVRAQGAPLVRVYHRNPE